MNQVFQAPKAKRPKGVARKTCQSYLLPMLKKLSIKRFKSIRSSTLEFGNVNMFIGGNGSGKSNVLEAIGVMSAALERGLGDGDLSKKGVRITPPELMKSAFKGYELPKTLELTANLEGEVEYRVNLTGRPDDPLLAFFSESCFLGDAKVFGRSHGGAQVMGKSISRKLLRHRSIWDQVRTAFEFPEPVVDALDSLSEYSIFAPQTDYLRGTQVGKVDTPPIGLHGEGLPEAVRGMILQWELVERRRRADTDVTFDMKRKAKKLAFLPRWARSVKVGKIEEHLASRDISERGSDMVYFVDRFMHSKRNRLSVYDSSEGALFLLFAAVLLSHDDAPQIFALDNVDSALNPKITRTLVETIVAITMTSSNSGLACGPKQVFLTSHNPTSLDAFDLFDDAQRIFVVARNKLGHTEVTPLKIRKDMSREDWMNKVKGRNLSQYWLDGEIRGALGQDV